MQLAYCCPECGTALQLQPEYTDVDAVSDDVHIYWNCPKCNVTYTAVFTKPSYRHLTKV